MAVAQLVRVLVCGAEGRGFEPHQPPDLESSSEMSCFFFVPRIFKAVALQIVIGMVRFRDNYREVCGAKGRGPDSYRDEPHQPPGLESSSEMSCFFCFKNF